MGLFDLFKKKPVADEGPAPHYAFAHYALRQIALADPLRFLTTVASEHAAAFFDAILQDVATQCGQPADFTGEDIMVHPVQIEGYPCAIIELPEPTEMAQAHMVAIFVDVDPMEPPEDASSVSARFFTLEKSIALDDEPSTVLGEWTDTTHANFGSGPDPTVHDFSKAIREHI